MKTNPTLTTARFSLPQVGDEYTYNGLPCWVIDVANDGAWFGVVQGIRRVDRNKGAFRRYDASDYPVKVKP